MSFSRLFPFALFGLLLTLALAQANKEEAPIRDIVKRMETGWNAASGSQFAAPFAENADYVVVNGMHIKKRPVIDQGHQFIFNGMYKGSRNEGTVESIRFIRPDVAIVHVGWKLQHKLDGKNKISNARATLVVAKNKGTWEIEAFQNTPIQ